MSDPIRPDRRLHRFHGGMVLSAHTGMSSGQDILSAPLPPRLHVPLHLHRGLMAEPIVKAGHRVLKGECIAKTAGESGSTVHAPTSGIVKLLARRQASHPAGIESLCITIEPDGLDQWTELQPLESWADAPVVELQQRIAHSGIVGLGGAVFPTSTKVDHAHGRAVHTLIINGAECEPYISCDDMLLRENSEAVITGAQILQKVLRAQRTIVAIEDDMVEAHSALLSAIGELNSPEIEIIQVPSRYPEGGEKQLIQVLTGLEVPVGGYPSDLGFVCHNIATAAAVADAVVRGQPLIDRVVTVTGSGVRQPRNVRARIGTPIDILIDLCGGYSEDAERLVLGGPMMGFALPSDANPVTAAANCVLVLSAPETSGAEVEMPCIRCGECARVCPAVLLPQSLNTWVRNERWDEANDYGLDQCIECGCCDLVCPSHIPLVEWFRYGKSQLELQRRERELAQAARLRFEARERRLERDKRERKQRLADKKRALADKAEKKKKIAEAIRRAQAGRDERQ